MNTPNAPSPPLEWVKAHEARRRLGIPGRALFESEIATGRLGLRWCRLGKRQMLMVAEVDVQRAAHQLAQGVAR